MRLKWKLLLLASAAIILGLLIIMFGQNKHEGRKNMPDGNGSTTTRLQLISPVFREGAPVPVQYTCKGQNVNPPLNIMKVPAGAQSLALIMHDPDAPSGDYIHWTMWDIPTGTETIAANSVPTGAVQGQNSSGQNKYMGPCPPSGTHRYMFELYALDTSLNLPSATTSDKLKDAMKGHVIEEHTLTGTFSPS